MSVTKAFRAIFRLLFPEHCCICERRLEMGEEYLCISCFSSLPFARIHGQKGNRLERLFWGRIPIVRATTLLRYRPKSDTRFLFFDLKYHNRPAIGISFGRIMATDVIATGFFEGIDAIIPIPLAKKRFSKRGYNQSEKLAQGISLETGIPVWEQCVVRVVETSTQTHLSTVARADNVAHIFRVVDRERIAGKHLLLVDDVITSGATLLSCAEELAKVEGVRISIMTLGIAGRHTIADAVNDIEPTDECLPFQ